MAIDAIITVRASSTRLPSKCFLNIANRSVFKHVIERASTGGLNPVVSTTTEDATIINLCQVMGVRCFAGSVNDKLDRWLGTCKHFNIESFVTIDCDDPLFDATLSHQQHALLMGSGADAVRPDMRAYLGSNGWAMKTEALERICKEKKSNQIGMIEKHFPSDLNVVGFDAAPDPIENDLRLTLDYIEDYWLILTVVRELSYIACDRPMIVEFFRKNPGLRVVNEFRNIEWKHRQALDV